MLAEGLATQDPTETPAHIMQILMDKLVTGSVSLIF